MVVITLRVIALAHTLAIVVVQRRRVIMQLQQGLLCRLDLHMEVLPEAHHIVRDVLEAEVAEVDLAVGDEVVVVALGDEAAVEEIEVPMLVHEIR